MKAPTLCLGLVLSSCREVPGAPVEPPQVRAEGLTATRDDEARVTAERAELLSDGGTRLRGVALSRGGLWVRAPQAEGLSSGAVLFLGGATAGLGTDAGSVSDTPDAGVAEPSWALSARRLRLDPRRGVLTLDGEVSLQRGALSLEAPRVEVTLDPGGGVARAVLTGPVSARTGTAVLRAPGGATVDVEAGTVRLPGPVRLEQAGVTLTAGGVTLQLSTGALELTDVRGTLRLAPR
ncbi:MAG: hypothetical protein HY909_30865 [Deltaproteobacteria bacterium]|nr:hypothetical protein [Deltaproteobacteria bacterium]